MTDDMNAGLRQLVAVWERKAKQAEEMLTHLRAALAIQEAESAPPAPPSRSPEVPPTIEAKSPKRRSAGPTQPFSTKYERTAAEYVLELPGIEGGLSLRQIQEALGANGKEYSDQAVNHTLKRLEKSGRIRKRPAPTGANALFVFQRIDGGEVEQDGPQRRLM
jgi:hypothetical protein